MSDQPVDLRNLEFQALVAQQDAELGKALAAAAAARFNIAELTRRYNEGLDLHTGERL